MTGSMFFHCIFSSTFSTVVWRLSLRLLMTYNLIVIRSFVDDLPLTSGAGLREGLWSSPGVSLGPPGGGLGVLLEPPGAVLGPLKAVWGLSGSLWERSGVVWEPLEAVFGHALALWRRS